MFMLVFVLESCLVNGVGVGAGVSVGVCRSVWCHAGVVEQGRQDALSC